MNEDVIDYSFVIARQKDGKIAIGNVADSPKQPSIDDIYASLMIILRDMLCQQAAATMLAAISQAQGNPQQSPGGVVVPKAKFQKVERAK